MPSQPTWLFNKGNRWTPRERMLTAYRNEQPDRVPVSLEIWDATAMEISRRPFHELVGLFAETPWWRTHLKAFEYFGCDVWIIAGAGDPEKKRGISYIHDCLEDLPPEIGQRADGQASGVTSKAPIKIGGE